MMNEKQATRTSKFLSLVLRHQPEKIGLTLDPAGWVEIDLLLEAMAHSGTALTREELEHVVATNDKKRFAISADGRRIRASQGHSVEVELGYTPAEPPEVLFHGTAERNLASIREHGLRKGERHHVHLSPDRETAVKVGQRYGRPAVMVVQAGEMHHAGHAFFLSDNGVWLTDNVPAQYLDLAKDHGNDDIAKR